MAAKTRTRTKLLLRSWEERGDRYEEPGPGLDLVLIPGSPEASRFLRDANWLTLDLVEGVTLRRNQTLDLDVSDDSRLYPETQNQPISSQIVITDQ